MSLLATYARLLPLDGVPEVAMMVELSFETVFSGFVDCDATENAGHVVAEHDSAVDSDQP